MLPSATDEVLAIRQTALLRRIELGRWQGRAGRKHKLEHCRAALCHSSVPPGKVGAFSIRRDVVNIAGFEEAWEVAAQSGVEACDESAN